jgi:hypothetical protein
MFPTLRTPFTFALKQTAGIPLRVLTYRPIRCSYLGARYD